MEQFFHETIESWEDWGRVYQSIEAFTPLVEEIFRREGVPFSAMENLTPGTNAVFRVGDAVVKVFFPKESGLDPSPDFRSESAVCGFLTRENIPVPKLLAKGLLRDKYDFHYILTEYYEGVEAGDWLPTASDGEKREFVWKLKAILCKLNRPVEGLIEPVDLVRQAVENERLEKLPASLREDMRRRARTVDLSRPVLVHGDLTGENLLVDAEEKPVVIDLADACLAPAWYEYGPLVFELFRCDPVALRELAGDDPNAFTEQVLDAVSIHDFGADLIRVAAEREGLPPFSHLDDVKAFLLQKLAS